MDDFRDACKRLTSATLRNSSEHEADAKKLATVLEDLPSYMVLKVLRRFGGRVARRAAVGGLAVSCGGDI